VTKRHFEFLLISGFDPTWEDGKELNAEQAAAVVALTAITDASIALYLCIDLPLTGLIFKDGRYRGFWLDEPEDFFPSGCPPYPKVIWDILTFHQWRHMFDAFLGNQNERQDQEAS